MAMSVADQRQAAEIVRTGSHLLNLDAVWTSGLSSGRPTSEDDRQTLVEVGSSMAADLITIRAQRDFLLRCAAELTEQLPDAGSFRKNWGMEAEGSLPELLTLAVQRLQDDGPHEVELLLQEVDNLQSGAAAEGDLSEGIRVAVTGITIALLELIWTRHGLDAAELTRHLVEDEIGRGVMRLLRHFWPPER